MMQIMLRNISTPGIPDTAPLSRYVVDVYVNGRLIAHETVEGHRRADGWKALLGLIAKGVES